MQVPGFTSYFLSYEYLSRSWASADGSVSSAAVLAAGGFAGAFSWVLTYPIDVVKSRLQVGVGGVVLSPTQAGPAKKGGVSIA